MTAEQLIEHSAQTCRGIFEIAGEILPMVHWVRPSGEHVLAGMPWRNRSEKEVSIAMLRRLFQEETPLVYCLIAEAWMAFVEEGQQLPEGGVQDLANRMEVLMFTAEDSQGIAQARIPIVREEGRNPCLGDLVIERPDRLEGLMVGLLPRERVQ
jgi:hypothetical protein